MIYGQFDNDPDREFIKNHILGINYFDQLQKIVDPDLTISLNDLGPIVIQKKMADKLGMNFVPYIPYDKDRMTSESDLCKYQFPAILTPSEHASVEYRKYVDAPVYTLPHIIEMTSFYKLDNVSELKKKWLGCEDCFVVVAVNRNNVRKRLDLLIQAFEEFAKDKPNVRLLLKTDPLDTTDRYESINAPQYNFTKYNHPQVKLITDKVTVYELNEIYNCGDVGLTTTSGEGFGLTPCEMSMCKTAQLVPRNTSHPWIFGEDYPGLIDCKMYADAVARSFLKVEQIEADLICVMKIYSHYNNTTEISETPLPVSKAVYTVVLSPTPEQFPNEQCFTSVKELIEHLALAVPKYHRVQILLNTNLEFMRGVDFDQLLDLTYPNRKTYVVKKDYISSYLGKFGETGLVDIKHTVELLEQCYRDPEFCRDLGEHCYEKVVEKFTKDQIVDQLDSLFSKLQS